MFSLLLAVIYLTFISLGLPDGLLGSAWPAMHVEFAVPVSAQSLVSLIISGCTIASSLMTARLVERLGTGRLCTISVALTAIAIVGFSQVRAFWQLCALAIPYGLGAGAIDAALNNYVALNYGQRHMSWLHCCWGVGATTGPIVMGWALGSSLGWSAGYLVIGAAQAAIALVLFASTPLWRVEGGGAGEARGEDGFAEDFLGANDAADAPADLAAASADPSDSSLAKVDSAIRLPSNRELLRLPGAKATILSFGAYCALESCTGLWIASYLVMARGIDAATAASIVSLFFLGITVGRFLSGAAASLLTSEQQIRAGLALVALGLVLLLLIPGTALIWCAVGFIGLGCAPIYPSIVALTPHRFGERASQGLVSLQMACAYTGSSLMPPIFGLVAGLGFAWAIPWMLVVLLVADIILCELATRRTA